MGVTLGRCDRVQGLVLAPKFELSRLYWRHQRQLVTLTELSADEGFVVYNVPVKNHEHSLIIFNTNV